MPMEVITKIEVEGRACVCLSLSFPGTLFIQSVSTHLLMYAHIPVIGARTTDCL